MGLASCLLLLLSFISLLFSFAFSTFCLYMIKGHQQFLVASGELSYCDSVSTQVLPLRFQPCILLLSLEFLSCDKVHQAFKVRLVCVLLW